MGETSHILWAIMQPLRGTKWAEEDRRDEEFRQKPIQLSEIRAAKS
jgi:hypothetical protein